MGWRLLSWFWRADAPPFIAPSARRTITGKARRRTAIATIPAMIQELSPKDPDSEEFFGWDFSPQLASGDTIASVVSVSFTETDNVPSVLTTPAINSAGTIVSAKLSACTRGKYYTVRCRALTTLGETLDLSLRFYSDDN